MIGGRLRSARGWSPQPPGRSTAPHVTLLRELRIDSPISRMWAGTKLLSVGALSITLSYFPTWLSIGLTFAVLVAAVLLGRIPPGAWPWPPRWFWITLIVTGALALLAGGSPYAHIGGVTLGLGAIDSYCKFVSIGVCFSSWRRSWAGRPG